LSSVKALLSRKISHRTHPLVYECKQMCSEDDGGWSCGCFERPLPPVDYQGLAQSVLLREWQG
jgi:hypothetical protein